ncbi:MAG: hypothetical protein HOP20_08310 [Sulfuriferula sp.]|nr:hypothetical protein [Sulfuriferula sp.]
MATKPGNGNKEKENNINTLDNDEDKTLTHVLDIQTDGNQSRQAEILARLLKKQTIYGKSGRITAVELMPRIRLAYSSDMRQARDLRAGDDATLFAGVFALTDDGKHPEHRLLISIDIHSLAHGDVAYLPVEYTILALSLGEKSGVVEFLPKIKLLLSQGYDLLLNCELNQTIPSALLGMIKQVRIDTALLSAIDIEQMVKSLREQGVQRIYAHNVSAQETLIVCQKLKLDGYEGDFCDSPLAFNYQLIEVEPTRVRALLAAVSARQDLSAIESMMRFDARLVYQLIRYVNMISSNDVLVSSIAEALQQLKLEGLQRWLSLLLNASVAPSMATSAVLKQAYSRGLLLESLSRKSLQVQDPQTMYLVGLLSLTDKLLAQPMHTLINPLKLSDDFKAAVIEYKGNTGLMLKLVMATESSDIAVIDNYAARCLISTTDVNLAMINALVAAETSGL